MISGENAGEQQHPHQTGVIGDSDWDGYGSGYGSGAGGRWDIDYALTYTTTPPPPAIAMDYVPSSCYALDYTQDGSFGPGLEAQINFSPVTEMRFVPGVADRKVWVSAEDGNIVPVKECPESHMVGNNGFMSGAATETCRAPRFFFSDEVGLTERKLVVKQVLLATCSYGNYGPPDVLVYAHGADAETALSNQKMVETWCSSARKRVGKHGVSAAKVDELCRQGPSWEESGRIHSFETGPDSVYTPILEGVRSTLEVVQRRDVFIDSLKSADGSHHVQMRIHVNVGRVHHRADNHLMQQAWTEGSPVRHARIGVLRSLSDDA
jgi:hypothetical protein